ncbi:MAG: hypothetical protein PHF84_11695 [bacterium]|nr:hypothetical protein [bacterium]
MNKNSLVYIFVLIFVLLLFFQVLGIAFLVLRTVVYLIFRFWYIWLVLFLLYFLFRKIRSRSPSSSTTPPENEDVIEVKDYKIK